MHTHWRCRRPRPPRWKSHVGTASRRGPATPRRGSTLVLVGTRPALVGYRSEGQDSNREPGAGTGRVKGTDRGADGPQQQAHATPADALPALRKLQCEESATA